MLLLDKKVFGQRELSATGTIAPLEPLLKKHDIRGTGRGYLRSIVGAQSRHEYTNAWSLVTSLRMRDCMVDAAQTVQDRVGWAKGWSGCKLDESHWTRNEQRQIFQARSARASRALSATLADKSKTRNQLECRRLVHLAALVALRRAMRAGTAGDDQFDRLVAKALTNERLEIEINTGLLQVEDLGFTPEPEVPGYPGDGVFRPGDIVAFPCYMPEAAGTYWQVENALCVGWRGTHGNLDFNEPLFAGGGLEGFFTEGELKAEIFRHIKDDFKRQKKTVPAGELQALVDRQFGKYGTESQLKARFSVKALDSQRTQNRYLPKLRPVVQRLKVLGGRTDLP